MKRAFIAALFLGLALPLAASGCGGKKGGGGGGEGLSKEAQADQELGKKLAAYIDMSNRFFDRAYDSRSRYLSWLQDPVMGPTCKERYISRGLYTIYAVDKLGEKIRLAKGNKPSLQAIEAAGDKVVGVLLKLHPALEKASRYYTQKDYKDDGCKGAQAMHPKLIALWKEFEAGEKALTAAITKESNALQTRMMERIAKSQGKDVPRYYTKKITLDARGMLALLEGGEGKADPAACAKAVGAIDTLVREMQKNASKGKQPTGYSLFRSRATSYVTAAKERMRFLKKGKPHRKFDLDRINSGSGWMVNGSYSKVVRAFNEMIEAANSVQG